MIGGSLRVERQLACVQQLEHLLNTTGGGHRGGIRGGIVGHRAVQRVLNI